MGYPMTFQRLVHRNFLVRGDYSENLDSMWQNFYLTRGYVPGAFPEPLTKEYDRQNDERRQLEGRLKLLAGDLRRLEKDAIDENAVCKYIAFRTGIEADVVAAVLKEFVNW